MAATDGRDAELFGECGSLLRSAAENAMIENSLPCFYLEFPLSGNPCTDLVVLYEEVASDSRFAHGNGFGYQEMLDWYSTLPVDRGYAMGFEVDTGTGQTDKAGIYFQPRSSTELIKPFLKTVGEESRASSYLAVSEHLPSHMPSAYIGLFPGREESPMRIGGYTSPDTSIMLAESPGVLRDAFEAIGFTAWDDEMLAICRDLYSVAEDTDYQFDIYPDGSLGDTFGLDMSLRHIHPNEAVRWIEQGNGKEIFIKLKNYGLIDDRYKKIPGASFAKGIPVTKEDGHAALLGLSCRFSYVKVKFKAGKPMPAKLYLRLNAFYPQTKIE